MIASTSVSSVAYCEGERTLGAGAAPAAWIFRNAASPSSERNGSRVRAPAPAPILRRALRRLTARVVMDRSPERFSLQQPLRRGWGGPGARGGAQGGGGAGDRGGRRLLA